MKYYFYFVDKKTEHQRQQVAKRITMMKQGHASWSPERKSPSVLLLLKWVRGRMKRDKPYNLGFIKPATPSSQTEKNGCLKHSLVFHSSSCGWCSDDALLKAERSCFDRSFLLWPMEDQTFIMPCYVFITS